MIAEFHFNSLQSGVEDPFRTDSPASADTEPGNFNTHRLAGTDSVPAPFYRQLTR